MKRSLRAAGAASVIALVAAMPFSALAGGVEAADDSSVLSVQEATASAAVSADASDDEVDTITVIGQRAMMASSISRQRNADGIESVITRDAIGQFPDQNVAESTRRLTGVNVLNDQGEGRFIAVRGLDPSLNASSINGVRIPAPEADTRAVALDVVPSELVESIEVKKTLTPDMDADTIGASIEINTTKGFDRKKPFISFNGEGSYNNLNELWSPKAGVDFAYPVSDKFGISGGFSYNLRKTATDNSEMDDWDITDNGVAYAGTVEYRDYDVKRKRVGGSLSLDFKPTDTTYLYTRGFYSEFNDTEKRDRLVFKLDEEPSSGDANTATFLSDDGTIEVRRGLKDRFEAQTIQSYEVGGETESGQWTVDYSAAYSQSQEHEFKTQDPTRFRHKFEDPGELGVTFDYTNLDFTTFDVFAGASDFLDPSNYKFKEMSATDGLTRDKEWSFKLNVARDYDLSDGATLQVKAGGKARLRTKFYHYSENVYDGFDGDYTLADVVGGQTYGLADISPLPDLDAVRAFYAANAASFELNDFDTTVASNEKDYDADEDIYAGYFMGRYTNDRMTLIAGLRMEHTKDDLSGNLVEQVDAGATYNGMVLADDSVFISPISFTNSYTDWLPSASLKYSATEEVILRAGVFKSVVRPKISDLVPNFNVEENDNNERKGSFGNPDLNPYRAWNFDASVEYYFARDGVIQIGAFYKKIENFIVDVTYEGDDAPYNGVFHDVMFDKASIPLNGDNATVKGVEFNYQQALTFLPYPLDGMLAGFNYTYTDAEGDFIDRTIPLPASSKHTYNAMIGYEKGPISLRATAAYRAKYLDELGGDPESDRYVQDHLQIDLSAKYKITDNLRFYVDFVNLNNEPYIAYRTGPVRDRLYQYETYSWTGKVGVKATF